MKRAGKGTYVVLTNGYLEEFKPELHEDVFESYQEALIWVHEQQSQYPDLDYYICSLFELHHCTAQRHIRNLRSNDEDQTPHRERAEASVDIQ